MTRLPSIEVLPFLLIVAVLLLSARLLGELFRKLKLPQVMGELMAGILLGPSCLKSLAPDFYHNFFEASANAGIAFDGLARIGILLLLFVAGMEINLKTIREKANAAAAISLSGIAFPFAFGFCGTWYFFHHLFPAGMDDKLATSLFMGTALSITALSVLAKILIDIDMLKSKFGNLMLTAAMIDDFIGWMLFSLVISVANLDQESGFTGWQVMFMVIGFATFVLTIGKRFLHLAFKFSNKYLSRGGGTLSVGIVFCLLGAIFTEWLGFHAIFAPLFFVSIGFRVNFLENFDWGIIGFILAISILGKISGGFIGARIGKFSKNEAMAIGFAMNARGSQEIVLGLIALNAGIITDQVFVGLVVMTFVTIMMAGPLMKYFLERDRKAKLPVEETIPE